MKTLTIEEVRDQLPQLIDDVATGDIIIVSEQGDPVAKITGVGVPTTQVEAKNAFGRWLQENPIPAGTGRSAEDVDRQIAEERDSWD